MSACLLALDVAFAAAELLSGEREGVFAFDKSAKITTKTADGVVSKRVEWCARHLLGTQQCQYVHSHQ